MNKLSNVSILTSLLFVIWIVLYGFYVKKPTDAIGIDTSETQFSMTRVLQHVRYISEKPHYVGSAYHHNVKDYIVSNLRNAGLDVQIQSTAVASSQSRSSTHVENILARVPANVKGDEKVHQLLLMAHYDSAPHSSRGASDDGYAVAILLESIRAFIQSKSPHSNDIIIMFSDAEELGLLGAKAFVREHAWAREVDLVMNFEARGSGGYGVMFIETQGGNKNLISSFVKAGANYPVASSLMYSVYKILPNDTDLSIFMKEGNAIGLNFAFIGDHFDYHTYQDSYERMDVSSIVHQADYLNQLLPHYSNMDLTKLKSSVDWVYFSVPLLKMITYPFAWIWPMWIMCLIVSIGVFVLFWRKMNCDILSALVGAIPYMLYMIFTFSIIYLGRILVFWNSTQEEDILQRFTYNGYVLIFGFAMLSIWVLFVVYRYFLRKFHPTSLMLFPLIAWLAINVLLMKYLAGAAFFIIPVFFLIGMIFIRGFSKWRAGIQLLALTFMAVPVLVIMPYLIKMFPVALGNSFFYLSSFLILLIGTAILPLLEVFTLRFRRLSWVFLILGMGSLVYAASLTSYSIDRRKPNSLNYIMDADTKTAYFTTYDRTLDEWTTQMLSENAQKGSIDRWTMMSKYNDLIQYHIRAAFYPIAIPSINIDSSIISEDEMCFEVFIQSQRQANRWVVFADRPIDFSSLMINGKPYFMGERKSHLLKGGILNHFIADPDELLHLEWNGSSNDLSALYLLEIKHDLMDNPYFSIPDRPDYMMPKPFVVNDATMVKMRLISNEK